MQGRLLRKYNNQYQAHPVDYWNKEFFIASSLGLDLIEFILDSDQIEKNPIMSNDGLERIKEVIGKTEVDVESICADCFMVKPLHSNELSIAKESLKILNYLINLSGFLNLKNIVIPCVDQSRLKNLNDIDRFSEIINSVAEFAELKNVNLSLETDLNPEDFSKLLNRLPSKKITVNYDIGNSASMGYDLREELSAYGHRISDIHIKDRILGGKSVLLGTGNADFELFFDELKKYNYIGPFIFQAYRDEEGIEIFRIQNNYMKSYINKYFNSTN